MDRSRLSRDRRLPVEMLAALFVIVLHATPASFIVNSHVLYLGGDTTADAWKAVQLLRSGHLLTGREAAYESGYYALVYVPFLLAFGNTIRCLQLASLSLSTAAVFVFYAYARRISSLSAAVCLGAVFATSPLLLANEAVGAEYNLPLLIGIVMLLDASRNKPVRRFAALTAGVFMACTPYLIIPLIVHLLGKGRGELKKDVRLLGWYLAGCLTIALKYFIVGPPSDEFGPGIWLHALLATNLARWRDPVGLLRTVVIHWGHGLHSFAHFHHREDLPAFSWVHAAWFLAAAVGLARRESRRMVLALGAGLILAALIQSHNQGLAMRHMLAFLPFQWLFLAPLMSASTKDWRRVLAPALILIACSHLWKDGRICRSAWPIGAKIRQDSELAARILASAKPKSVEVTADNSNAFFLLRFLEPSLTFSFSAAMGSPGEGIIYCEPGAAGTVTALPTGQRFALSGRTTYDLVWRVRR